ncbi:CENP-S complex, centromere protein X [Pochonia chlamydosporia 170]|uniref:CENP-S complex, centromere protein X n=1 Tax=Pochonia chlamydosporia 170 TaxID=1380566 RepID=A0A179G5T8_METCM|nr:CENP-S complex, centromere protein X [Pochonia chlamydosporia 170]OAQ73194.1 CENP-S complex, centromere protein X [Pochonia chlamydosporia 170]
MPPKETSGRGRGRPKGTTNRRQSTETASSEPSDPFESSDDQTEAQETRGGDADDAPPPEKSIPKDLLTRILHEFFTKDSTRISRDANAAMGKYMDIFVREAIARAAVEKNAGFLEVDDLEKIAPQLLLDL